MISTYFIAFINPNSVFTVHIYIFPSIQNREHAMPQMHQCLCSEYIPKDLQEQVHELEFSSRSGHTITTASEMKGGRQGNHLDPLAKPAIGPAFPPGSALRRTRRKAHLLSRTRVLNPDMGLLVSQFFLLKHADPSTRTSRICQSGKFKETMAGLRLLTPRRTRLDLAESARLNAEQKCEPKRQKNCHQGGLRAEPLPF